MSEEEEEQSGESQAVADGEETARETEAEKEQDVTEPGEWERKPADAEDLRHDDGSEPLAEPSDSHDDDLAEKEAGDVSVGDDEGFDRPDPPEEAGLEDTGGALEHHAEPFLQGSEVKTPVGAVPSRSLVAMAAFIVVFCVVFFALWGLLGSLGILLGLLAGPALGFVAMKLLADRERAA